MAKNRQADPEAKVRYLIQAAPKNFMIEIPAIWKVTFSAVNPSTPGNYHGNGYAVRVWEGEKLRAVYTGVQALRDLAIPMVVENRKETGSSTWEKDSEGNFENQIKVEVSKQFQIEPGADEIAF